MRISPFIFGALLCTQIPQVQAMTLQEAMDTAKTQHPMLEMTRMQVENARGVLLEQSAYAYNPELSVEPQKRRLKGGGNSNDIYLTLSQSVELSGKRSYRTMSAQAALHVSELALNVQRQSVIFSVARAYINLMFSKRSLVLRQHQRAILEQLKKSIIRQQELGEMNQLDVNLAKASLMQALHAEVQAEQVHVLAMSAYQFAVGHTQPVDTMAMMLPRFVMSQNIDHPVQYALNYRPEVKVAKQRVVQYTAQADLAKAQKTPDFTVSLAAGREAGDQIYSVGLSMPLPVLNSHDGAYRAALSQVLVEKSALRWLEKRIKLEVQEARNAYVIAVQALHAVAKHETNTEQQISLAKKAFDAGELDTEELVLHINQLLESRINMETVEKEAWLSKVRFAKTLGQPQYILKGTK